MNLNRIGLEFPITNSGSAIHKTPTPQTKESFSEVLSQYLNDANKQMLESENLTAKLATGEVNNLHEVTIAAQKASIALQLTVQVRDKALEAYQEIMRMQV
ncbi:flagellar hook-basal body complex protein FliE [Ammoniphilus resinae]|uniref:Flagellar hook-basal body complex protein FliE n=1 Tax=Ammoniphilus resinae TaxID=861532 RepID=A0ABS4GKK2_9BACL|nr:flagellar hook-basal body complex protein FliE [Ammoniphilus resinae]MBP1930785.1 flagellar hook-basal body complex protein FliE [Ammoniphilus resinae]